MITEEHLEHWIKETRRRLDAMNSEININKLTPEIPINSEPVAGVDVQLGVGKSVHVSFEYLREKIFFIQGFMRCIEDDMKND